jgi:hypothetical protein
MRAIPQVCVQCADNGLNSVKLDPKEAESKHVKLLKIHKSIIFLLPAADLTENTQSDYEIYSVLLPIFMVDMAAAVMCKNCGKVLDVIRMLIPDVSYLIMGVNLNFLT